MGDVTCAALSLRTNFPDYISLIKNATDGDFSLVSRCREQVCSALWGTGNPDISGIGMAIGYVSEIVVTALLILLFLILNFVAARRRRLKVPYARVVLSHVTATFYDNAVFFTCAVQLASIIILARANSGSQTEGMGAITMKITWTISNLTLLPLLPLALGAAMFWEKAHAETTKPTLGALQPYGKPGGGHVHDTAPPPTDTDGDGHGLPSLTSMMHAKSEAEARHRQRFGLLVLCWCLSFYPFLSRMIANYGTSQIGDGPGAVISTAAWSEIETACFQNVNTISAREDAAMNAFGVLTWLFISAVVIFKIVLLGIESKHERQWRWLKDRSLTLDTETVTGARIWVLVCVVVLVLGVAQVWAFFRLQGLQRDMSREGDGSFADEKWTFGQIVSVSVFLPAVVEGVHFWRNKGVYSAG